METDIRIRDCVRCHKDVAEPEDPDALCCICRQSALVQIAPYYRPPNAPQPHDDSAFSWWLCVAMAAIMLLGAFGVGCYMLAWFLQRIAEALS